MKTFILLLLFSTFSYGSTVPEPSESGELLSLVNQHRATVGSPPLELDENLSTLAQSHTLNMSLEVIPFGHAGFSERCALGREQMAGKKKCAENVAFGQLTPEAVMASWLKSPVHRSNIENPAYTHLGIGFQSRFWTQIFLGE